MDRNKIVVFSLTQVTEAGNSNRMEKMGFKKASHLDTEIYERRKTNNKPSI